MIVALVGDLDLASVPTVRSASAEIAADGWKHVVVDLGDVNFIDSAGMGALIGLRRRALAAGGECVLASPTSEVSRQLEAAELDRLFAVYTDVDEAAERSTAA